MKDDRIAKGSMGSYLLPPHHPGYNFQVEHNLKKKKENRGSTSLEYFVSEKYTAERDPDVLKEARTLIANWHETKLPIEHLDVQNWISECERHFSGMKTMFENYIKKYYPDYKNKSL